MKHKRYKAEPMRRDGRYGWGVRDNNSVDGRVLKFFRNRNNSAYLPDWHVIAAKITAWYYNNRGENR